jgi:SAM-dependent methyltransferase
MKMDDLKQFYNQRFEGTYRETLTGFEVARWRALGHVIQRVIKNREARKILDYGCGSGAHVELWKKNYPHADLWFTDISSVALEKLAAKHPEYKARCKEIFQHRAPFEDGFFDAVVSVEVMEHVSNLSAYLDDIFRLLRPQGIFIWTTPCANPFSIEHIYALLTNRIQTTGEGYIRWKWEVAEGHLRRLKTTEIKALLQRVGFSDVDFRLRSHFFSFVCTSFFRGPLRPVGEKLMLLDYLLFRKLPNGASMIGFARKQSICLPGDESPGGLTQF